MSNNLRPLTQLPPPRKSSRRLDWLAFAITLFALAGFIVWLSSR